MTYLFILPFIAMACIYLVVIANLHFKLSKWLCDKHLLYKSRTSDGKICLFTRLISNYQAHRSPVIIPLISCESCLTWWISLFYLILHTDPFQAIILAGATAYLTAPLKRLL